jgi:superoxide dismutase, Cu-Zn family
MLLRSLTVAAVITTLGASSAAAVPWDGALRVTTAAAPAEAFQPDAGAVTYSPLVPSGAQLAVLAVSTSKSTSVLLSVQGLLPHRAYGAHVHVKPCGPAPADSGPHFQNVPDPVQPSVDPKYANPRNEIWLDFTTDPTGNAVTVSHVPWGFGDRMAGSVVIHETHTHTDPGHAGTAGARLACLNAEF